MLNAFAKKLVELFACGGDVTAMPKAPSASIQFVRLQTTAKLYISAVLIACCSLVSLDAQAAGTITIVQSGANVTATLSGTLTVPVTTNTSQATPFNTLIAGGAPGFLFRVSPNTSGSMLGPVPLTSQTCANAITLLSNAGGTYTAGSITTAVPKDLTISSIASSTGIYFDSTLYTNGNKSTPQAAPLSLSGVVTFSGYSLNTLGLISGSTSCTYNTGITSPSTDTITITAYIGSAVPPSITTVSPSSGGTSGGTSVTITGTNLDSATAVTIGGVAATVVSNSATSITATTGVHAAGAVDVAVTTANGTGTLPGAFTYTAPLPTITSITPSSGTTAGGTSITINGTNLSGGTVTIGGTAATVTATTASSITATTPSSVTSGAKDVVVTVSGNSVTSTGGYTYVTPATASAVTATLAYNATSANIPLTTGNTPTSVAVSTQATHGTAVATGTTIAYTPTTGYFGTDTFYYTATNAGGTSSPVTATITISPPTLVANPAAGTLAAGTVGTAYSTTLTTSGGASPYTYALTTGTLPAGLSLNTSTGVVSGTPTAAGTSNFTITATDSSTATHATLATSYSIVVSLATQATLTASAAATTINTNGTTTLSTSGGSGGGAVTYAVASGSCTISGTTLTAPASAGTCTVTATKAANGIYDAATSAAITITVNTTPTPTLTFATQNTASVTLTGSLTNAATSSIPSGGAITYASSNSAVATVDSSGVITTASAGTTIITATQAAAPGVNASATQTYTLTVNTLLTPTLTFATPTSASVALAGALTNAATSSNSGGSYGAISYSSSNTGVATVAAGGVITTVAAGTTVITATQAAVAGVNAQATQTYTLTVLSTDATLSAMTISSGTLSPAFASATTAYTASVANSVSSITLTPTRNQANATITVNGSAVTSGSASGAIALTVGTNTITTVVTAQDGSTTKTYTVTVTRAASANADLSSLALSSGTLSPTFASATTTYTASVTNSVATLTVSPTVTDSTATVKVNGTTVTSGSASGSISLSVGSNTITTVVTAQDGSTTKTYTMTVTRAAPASTVATLSAMTLSSGTLSPTFASGTTSYTASVTNATSSITVTPTVTQANATVTVGGNTVTSGSASGSVTLNVGANTINTIVTAQDGTTTQTYAVVVTRAALLAQASFTVSASPTTLNATTTTSTLSTSGGSGTGAVTYAMTAGTCTVSGTTATAGTTSETCTVTATKASDGTYAAATATVNITVARRANIAAAATDASVLAIHGAQIMQSQKFVTTQIDNVANHLNGYRNNFNLRPSNFGFGVNIQMPSLGPASQALYKIKDELTPRPEMQAQNKLQSKDTQAGMKKVGYVEEQDLTPYNDYMREEALAAGKGTQEQKQDEKQVQEQIDQSQYYAANSQYERENLTYSIWTAGTIDYATYKTGDNKETQNKLTANGLTMGIDYKLHDAAIVGAAVGVGTAWQSAVAINTNLKAKQTAVTGYGMFGFADHWVVEGLMGYGVVDFSGNRTTSDGAAQLGVNRKGETLFSSGTISKMYWVEGYKVTPFARQDVMHINLHSYAETGAADYALGFDGTNFVHTTTSGGLQVSRDIFLEGAKLTPTAKIALNRIRTGGLAQNIYYADTGAAGGVYTLNQTGSYMTTQSLGLGLIYTTRAGDGFDLGWQGAMGANQYRLNGLRFAVRFAM